MGFERLREITRNLVAFNTVSTKEINVNPKSNKKCAHYIADILKAAGFNVNFINNSRDGIVNLSIVAHAGPHEKGGLILSGHMDTVSFDRSEWNSEPLNLVERDGCYIGRGVSDMKAFIAQCMVLSETIPINRLKKPLFLILTSDEEIGCLGSKGLVDFLLKDEMMEYLPTVAIIGEPTNFKIFTASKGYAEATVSIRGKGMHSSRPDLGTNAIELASKLIHRIGEVNTRLQNTTLSSKFSNFSEFPYSHINCGLIAGGTAPNLVPEECSLHLSMRLMPDSDLERIIQEVSGTNNEELMFSGDSYPSTRLDLKFSVPPMNSTKESELLKIMETHFDLSEYNAAPFVSDGSNFEKLRIHSYICGPGLLEQAHQANEAIPIANLEKGLILLRSTISYLF